MSIRPPIQYHGGKWFLKDWIISNFPSNYELMDYLEPFIGGGNVLLNKKESKSEIANDLNNSLYYLWLWIKNYCDFFTSHLKKLEYSEKTFLSIKNKNCLLPIDIGIKEFVLRRMSRGGLGKNFSWQTRLRGGKPGSLNAWETSLSNLKIVSKRIQNVTFYNGNAINLLSDYDSPNLFCYLDPPYLQETRKSKIAYEYEMSTDDHIKLLNTIRGMKGRILISGYNSKLYDNYLGISTKWTKIEKQVKNHSGQNRIKQERTEVLWRNY